MAIKSPAVIIVGGISLAISVLAVILHLLAAGFAKTLDCIPERSKYNVNKITHVGYYMSNVSRVNEFFMDGPNSVYSKLTDVVGYPLEKIKFNKINNDKLRIFLVLLSTPIIFASFVPLLVISAAVFALAFCVHLIALTFAALADGIENICCTSSKNSP